MPNFEHQQLLERIRSLDQPPDDPESYAKWLQADAQLEFLRRNANAEELIIYAGAPHTFIHTVPVCETALTPLDVEDLLLWSGSPFDSCTATYEWTLGEGGVGIAGSSGVDSPRAALNQATPLVYGRALEGLPGEGISYFEPSQRYLHLTGAHHRPERSAYCRFDEQGEFEHVVSITVESSSDEIALVTFKREPLEEYLAASRSILVTMFDYTLLRYGNFDRWPDTPEEVIEEDSLFFRRKVDSGRAAYVRGIQLVRPRRSESVIFSAIKGERTEPKEYVEFDAYDFRNGRVRSISTDPQATTNYFQTEGNSLPFELSPAFFRPEVLTKYKNDTEKYAVENRNIDCRGSWRLRSHDVNQAGQIHAYICDLRNLPLAEQVYWKSFNEPPKTGISERAWKNDFCGQWAEVTDPLERIKLLLNGWIQSAAPWWSLREEALMRRASTPRTDAVDEWAREVKNFATLLVEGFEVEAIRSRLGELGLPWTPEERSLVLLGRVLSDGASAAPRLGGLRAVQRIRSKVDSHARGAEARSMAVDAIREHGSYTAQFQSLCLTVLAELESIGQAFGEPESGEDQDD